MQEIRSGRDVRQRKVSIWPRYDAAVTGLRNYWYPVMWSRQLGRKPVAIKVCDEPVMLIRQAGKAHALFNQCPHRGVPLSVGRQDFPNTWSCRYHGWVFDIETGILKAALTDGPDSPICGKVRVQTYPVEERAGLIWVYVGDEPPPPVEADIPKEFLEPNALVLGRISIQKGNWRYAVENGFDEGHAMYLHRYGAIETFFRELPAWRRTDVVPDEDGYIGRATRDYGRASDYPGLGRWPRRWFWQRRGKGHRVTVRLPGFIRIKSQFNKHARFVWWTPIDKDHYRMLQFYVEPSRGMARLKFWAYYELYRKWVHHVQFNNQDAWMVSLVPETPPERFYRPDASITAWRKLCEHARGEPPVPATLDQELEAIAREQAAVEAGMEQDD